MQLQSGVQSTRKDYLLQATRRRRILVRKQADGTGCRGDCVSYRQQVEHKDYSSLVGWLAGVDLWGYN